MEGFGGKERRQFQRWKVSIPCLVQWNDTAAQGTIINLSYSGAFIYRVTPVPQVGTLVLVTFQGVGRRFKLTGSLSSRIAHSILGGKEGVGSVGVAFQKTAEEVQSLLSPTIRALTESEE